MQIILLDCDGVINRSSRYFSDVYSQEFDVDTEILLEFFDGGAKDLANIGKKDLKDALSELLERWKWGGTVDELLEYWFASDFEIDLELKSIVEEARRDDGVKFYLATDQEKYRTSYIWEDQGLSQWLDGKFVSCELGFLKRDPEFFVHVLETLKCKPEDVTFLDDSKSKVDAARRSGIDARLYTDIGDLKAALAT